MNAEGFIAAYTAGRNGANQFMRHPLARRLVYSDGVQECAEAGCYWLLDIAGTECAPAVKRYGDMGVLHVDVADSAAEMRLELSDGAPPAWKRSIEHTDLPAGRWTFFMFNEGDRVTMILPSEY